METLETMETLERKMIFTENSFPMSNLTEMIYTAIHGKE